MEPRVAVLEEALTEHRERYNTVFALARRARPRLDGELFMAHLRDLVAPIVAAAPAEAAKSLVEPLYDLCLELTGHDMFRRSPAVTEVWSRLLTQAGLALVLEPRLLPAALTNAAYNLEREESADAPGWIAQMEQLRPFCDSPAQWLQVGQVASWLCGMAHYRESAIVLARSLPDALRDRLCPSLESFAADPWCSARQPEAPPRIVRVVGGFVGFGGRFRQPPWVAYAGDGRFLVEDGSESWVLSCDGFGATLRSGTAEICESPNQNVDIDPGGCVRWNGRVATFDLLHPVRSSALSPHVLAVTSEHSHHVYLIMGG